MSLIVTKCRSCRNCIDWRDAGELTEEQALWFRATKPEEELFDLEADPHELHNLVMI